MLKLLSHPRLVSRELLLVPTSLQTRISRIPNLCKLDFLVERVCMFQRKASLRLGSHLECALSRDGSSRASSMSKFPSSSFQLESFEFKVVMIPCGISLLFQRISLAYFLEGKNSQSYLLQSIGVSSNFLCYSHFLASKDTFQPIERKPSVSLTSILQANQLRK